MLCYVHVLASRAVECFRFRSKKDTCYTMLKYGIWREIRAQVVGCAAAAAVLIFYSYQYFNRINILILSIFYSYPSNYF